jgi:hypothetical protein
MPAANPLDGGLTPPETGLSRLGEAAFGEKHGFFVAQFFRTHHQISRSARRRRGPPTGA